ncbi:signal peptidase I [Bacillus sp. AGMB 02131]|uniref:Signal peptidase I n=1 Tax=Peribacillus faecalis TaxID=2772559 RepID=A0A927CXG3_9BACI|nr:signal peptidase I [Peribacillus faecalis]MBD3109517.1 signal peptidase I [Peribacillus faecalis]
MSKLAVELKSWLKAIVLAVVIAIIVRSFIFSSYTVEGQSMEPTLFSNEKMIVNKMDFIYSFKHGDIIIIEGLEDEIFYVKRLIGLPGDTIEMNSDILYVNGKEVKEAYLEENKQHAHEQGSLFTGNFGPITVPEGEYFVLGDNRLNSTDSRNGLGLISEERIVGTSEFIFYPLSEIRVLE